ncbi:MAG: hypothetical protein RDU25_01225 [Patescibacteria group bacterium]|nr:hypothetical protein [Patescibacteria group bacterium]
MEDESKHEILEAISLLADNVQSVSDRVDDLSTRMGRVETTMVTKSYLDDKLADLRGDLIVLARKQNTKLNILIESLVAEGILPRKVADKILALEPFPELV